MVAKPIITQSPPAPDPNQPATFDTRAGVWAGWLSDDFAPDLQQAVDYVDQEATTAQAAANTALIAAASTDATEWVSEGTYSTGDARWSPLNGLTYRAKTNHSGLTTDPSLDTANWVGASIDTKQSSPDDDTPGVSLVPGAFGHNGGAALNWSYGGFDPDNPPVKSGYGWWGPSNTAMAAALASFGTLWTAESFTTWRTQWATFGRDGATRFAVRTSSGGSFNAWNELFGRQDFLDPVSQSGGVPTGGAMETGSNVNGQWQRFADGTQVCTISIDNDAQGTWVFPAAFTEIHAVHGGYVDDSSARFAFVMFDNLTTSQVAFNVFADVGVIATDGTCDSIRLTVRGRWY